MDPRDEEWESVSRHHHHGKGMSNTAKQVASSLNASPSPASAGIKQGASNSLRGGSVQWHEAGHHASTSTVLPTSQEFSNSSIKGPRYSQGANGSNAAGSRNRERTISRAELERIRKRTPNSIYMDDSSSDEENLRDDSFYDANGKRRKNQASMMRDFRKAKKRKQTELSKVPMWKWDAYKPEKWPVPHRFRQIPQPPNRELRELEQKWWDHLAHRDEYIQISERYYISVGLTLEEEQRIKREYLAPLYIEPIPRPDGSIPPPRPRFRGLITTEEYGKPVPNTLASPLPPIALRDATRKDVEGGQKSALQRNQRVRQPCSRKDQASRSASHGSVVRVEKQKATTDSCISATVSRLPVPANFAIDMTEFPYELEFGFVLAASNSWLLASDPDTCYICLDSNTNDMLECDRCLAGCHIKCTVPPSSSSFGENGEKWYCTRCTAFFRLQCPCEYMFSSGRYKDGPGNVVSCSSCETSLSQLSQQGPRYKNCMRCKCPRNVGFENLFLYDLVECSFCSKPAHLACILSAKSMPAFLRDTRANICDQLGKERGLCDGFRVSPRKVALWTNRWVCSKRCGAFLHQYWMELEWERALSRSNIDLLIKQPAMETIQYTIEASDGTQFWAPGPLFYPLKIPVRGDHFSNTSSVFVDTSVLGQTVVLVNLGTLPCFGRHWLRFQHEQMTFLACLVQQGYSFDNEGKRCVSWEFCRPEDMVQRRQDFDAFYWKICEQFMVLDDICTLGNAMHGLVGSEHDNNLPSRVLRNPCLVGQHQAVRERPISLIRIFCSEAQAVMDKARSTELGLITTGNGVHHESLSTIHAPDIAGRIGDASIGSIAIQSTVAKLRSTLQQRLAGFFARGGRPQPAHCEEPEQPTGVAAVPHAQPVASSATAPPTVPSNQVVAPSPVQAAVRTEPYFEQRKEFRHNHLLNVYPLIPFFPSFLHQLPCESYRDEAVRIYHTRESGKTGKVKEVRAVRFSKDQYPEEQDAFNWWERNKSLFEKIQEFPKESAIAW